MAVLGCSGSSSGFGCSNECSRSGSRGCWVASGAEDGSVAVWSLGGELLWMDEGHHGAGVELVAATGGRGGGQGPTLVTGEQG